MDITFEQLLSFTDQSALGLLEWSWQASVLLVCVWFLLQIQRTKAPALRHQIWLCGLIIVAVMPLLAPLRRQMPQLPLARPASNILNPMAALRVEALPALSTEMVANDAPVKTTNLSSFIPSLLFAAWLLGIFLMLMRLAGRQILLRRTLAEAQPVTLEEIGCAEVKTFYRRVPRLWLSAATDSPILCGAFRPVIMLPADIVDWTSPVERTAMIRHELAHLERGDLWVQLFQTVLRTIFFFHPLVSYACRQLCLERELACDDRVIGLGTAPEVYAAGILKVAERSLTPGGTPQLALFSNKKMLERRLDMILNPERKRILSARLRYLIFPLALLAMIGGLLVPGRPVSHAATPLTNHIPAMNKGDDEQMLLELFRRFSEAAARGDYSLAKLIGLGDLIHTDGNRTFIVVKGTKLDNVEIIRFEVENATPSVKGDTATVAYKTTMRLKRPSSDEPFDLSGSFTTKFIKRDGQWQAAYSKKSAPPPPKN
jgi:beta-lactamase regulating signal transducer with metallopeptidase domain